MGGGGNRRSWRKIFLIDGKLRRLFGLLCAIVGPLTGGMLAWSAEQPIAFPHNTHIKMGVDCVDCHTGADIRAAAGIPSVAKCMLCHAKLAREKPEVKKVIDYANKKIEIPWQRVYGFDASAHVKFRHQPHFQAKIECATCHGDLTKATVAVRLVNHNMGTCLTCHRQNKAPEDCAACHY
jgi:Cytochrome c3